MRVPALPGGYSREWRTQISQRPSEIQQAGATLGQFRLAMKGKCLSGSGIPQQGSALWAVGGMPHPLGALHPCQMSLKVVLWLQH